MKARRTLLAVLACLCALATCVGLLEQTASAAVTHKYLSQITEVPASSGVSLSGPLDAVNALAVDSGNLYVAENIETGAGGERLDEFDASSGAFVRQFSLPSLLHAFYFFGLAASHASGEEQVYAGAEDDEVKDFVTVFDGEGHLLGAPWSGADTPAGSFSPFGIGGIAADGSSSLGDWAAGDVYVSDRANKIVDVFKPLADGKEEYVTQIEGPETGVPFGEPSLVAVDQANGDVVVVDNGNTVDVFEPTAFKEYVLLRQITGTPSGPFQQIPTEQLGKGLAVDSTGDIYVADDREVEGATSEKAVYQFGAGGEYLGRLTGTPSRPFYRVKGLAVDPTTHDLYVGDQTEHESEEPGAVDIFGPNVVVPDVTTGVASNVKPTSATLNGTVNPDNAGEATCQFVWGATITFGNTRPCPDAIPDGASPVAVQVNLNDLTPDTTYHYRLQAANANGLNAGEADQDQELHTTGPGIHEEWSTGEASSSVTLNAKIDPNGAPTSYYFQYGTDTGYGESAPPPPGASIGTGHRDVTVNQDIHGLSSSTIYHYRVVAISDLPGGEAVEFDGPDHTFLTQAAASGLQLPDGRAWEMVSPPDKKGSALETQMTNLGSVMQAATGGNAVTYVANGPTEEEPQGNRSPEPQQLFSTRTAGGWATKNITTPIEQVGGLSLGVGEEYKLFSPDLSLSVLSTTVEGKLSGEATELTPYLRHDYTCESSPASCYVPLVTPADVEPSDLKWAGPNRKIVPYAGSPDLSHVIIQSNGVQLLPGGIEEQVAGDYEWSKGKLQLVSILPDGSPAPKGGTVGFDEGVVRHAVSSDGSRIVFEAAPEGGGIVEHLYSRDMVSGQTSQLDAVQPGAQGGEGEAVFQTASADGSKVFFTDNAKLTSDSSGIPGLGAAERGSDLYEYETTTGSLRDLAVPLKHGEHAGVQGWVQGASEDGSYVYFVANGVLAPGATSGDCPEPGSTCNLYVHHEGVTTFIASLASEDQPWNERSNLEHVSSRVSPDGRWFAFMSDLSLTGYDNRDANSGEPDEEVFLYDASSNRLVCASCDPTGARPTGIFEAQGAFNSIGPLVDRDNVWRNRWVSALIPGWPKVTNTATVYQPRFLSDGGRLFFDSNEALAPQDVNGKMDVYEYEPVGKGDCARENTTFSEASHGCVGLISSGGAAEESVFMDASETGNDVFFLTAAELRPEDYDNALDMYDARVCTGSSPCIPLPAASPPPCTTGDSCKPAPSIQPAIFGAPPSATFAGVGNIIPGSRGVATRRSSTRAVKLARALKACKHQRRKRKRVMCERQARRRYSSRSQAKKSVASRARAESNTSGRR